jgi:hypothetical protein
MDFLVERYQMVAEYELVTWRCLGKFKYIFVECDWKSREFGDFKWNGCKLLIEKIDFNLCL